MCLDDQILNTYLDGELVQPWKSQVEEHLKSCRACQNRLDNLKYLDEVIKGAEISDEEIQNRKEKVFAYLEKNVINKSKKKSAWQKQIKFSVSQLVGVAAAFVVVFVGSWTVLGSKTEQSIPLPDAVPSIVDIANITPARAVDASAAKGIDSYSLEEILQNLDARGYDVDIRLKGIHPIEIEVEESEVHESENN